MTSTEIASTANAPSTPSEVRWLDDAEMAAWLPLIRLIYLLPHALDQKLREDVGISLSYYSMLAMLSADPERTMSMGELARLTATSPSRLSHAVTQLEHRGWVRRRPCPTDRRIQYATLTDEGFAVLERIAPAHVAEVRRLIFDRLDREQVEHLREIGARLTEGLDQA